MGWWWKPGRGRGGWGWGGGGWGPVPPQPAVTAEALPKGAVPLATLPPGSRARVAAILAGAGAVRRALSLGLAPGTVIEVVDNNPAYPWTPIIVRVHGVEIAVGRGLAAKIYVVPEGGEASGGGKEPS